MNLDFQWRPRLRRFVAGQTISEREFNQLIEEHNTMLDWITEQVSKTEQVSRTGSQNRCPRQNRYPRQMKRLTWDDYFFEIARVVASRSTCPRKRVGAILVSAERRILTTGYNGAMPGDEHCDDVGCNVQDNHCVRTVHAEVNALAQAARHGISVEGATLYSTLEVCWNCYKALVSAGVKNFKWDEGYCGDPRINDLEH